MAEKSWGNCYFIIPFGRRKTTLVKKIALRKNTKFQFHILQENQDQMKEMEKTTIL